MQGDACVLIGPEFLIGGEGSYQEIIDTVKKLGEKYQKRIREEYWDINVEEC